MTETGFFPPPHYAPGEHIIFEKPEHTEWTVIAKLSQRNSQKEEVDIQAGLGPSYALATFRVRSDLDGQEAYMCVYLQVPNKGTEFFPPDERAKQAAPSHHLEVEAIKSFYKHGSTITPALLAIKEDIQDKQGFIPGGYVIHIVFQRVPGVRLADDRLLPGWGAPLHTFFQSFNDLQRHQIRMWFNKEYRKLKELGWVPSFPWASNLIWDASFSKLYFVDFREARKAGSRDEDVVDDGDEEEEEVPMCEIWEGWGLAIAPDNPKDRADLSKWKL